MESKLGRGIHDSSVVDDSNIKKEGIGRIGKLEVGLAAGGLRKGDELGLE